MAHFQCKEAGKKSICSHEESDESEDSEVINDEDDSDKETNELHGMLLPLHVF